MWRKNDGFFLAELLLTLSAWLLIASVLFPLIIQAVNQSLQVRQEFLAAEILYESLIDSKKRSVYPLNETIVVNQTLYEIITKENGESANMEVCIKYEDFLQKSYETCEIFE
ncbi:phosphatase [Cytobacillus massiliigabonensis]|uniref:phosphatase n=1 Tax=Cytobacillus massiliigabonensis TaxID=1871011 RepID=UPI000C833821|nr:phosphatase [Cytobacillus massiliigabonensis]